MSVALDQRYEQVKGFGRERDRLTFAQQQTLGRIQPKGAEFIVVIRTLVHRDSAEVFHQHNIAALLIYLRKEQPLVVGRNRQSPDITENRFLWRRDRRDLACRKAEEFNQRAPVVRQNPISLLILTVSIQDSKINRGKLTLRT
jgi:hypothetical protein